MDGKEFLKNMPLLDHCANCISKLRSLFCEKKLPVDAYPCSCAACRKLELRRCSGCKMVRYCSRECQQEHWHTSHKDFCKILSGKTKIEKVNHRVNSCLACTEEAQGDRCPSLKDWKVTMISYFQIFGCELSQMPIFDEGDRGHQRLQFPFQLGECTGVFHGWIDQSLYWIIGLLRLARKEEKRRRKDFNDKFEKLENELLELRVFYWFLATITTTKNKALLDILFSQFTLPRFIGGDSSRSLLQSIVDVKQFAKSPSWEAFEEYTGVFLQRLRRRKYFCFNLDSIPEHKVDKFSALFENSSISDVPGPDLATAERKRPQRLSVVLPPDCRCYGCGRLLGGEERRPSTRISCPVLP